MHAIDPAIGLANRVLEREDWARERLAAHAGATVRFVCGPLDSILAIAPSGMLSPPPGDGDRALSLTLSLSPLSVPTLLAHPERWAELVTAMGDAALAATFADLARTLPWFVEQAFASALGPLIGTRVANAGRALLSVPEQVARSVGSSLTSYARDEADLAVGGTAAAAFAAEVAEIAARVDALEQRLERAGTVGSAKAATARKKR